MAFESLGENCEFGLVQRHFGAEPLGLLRFSGTKVDQLIDALHHNFEGVGQPDQTQVIVVDEFEYHSVDLRYGFSSHSLVLADSATLSEASALIERRAKFLMHKMLEDLRSAPKIYVFQSADDVPHTNMSCLLSALRRHGPGRLLWVRPDIDPALHGTVTVLEDGLMLGYLDRPGRIADTWMPSNALWIRVLRSALKLSRCECAARFGV